MNTLQQQPLTSILWKFTWKSIGFQYIFNLFQYIFLKTLLCINKYAANSHISFEISTIIALKKIALSQTENLSLHSAAIITIKYTYIVGPTLQNLVKLCRNDIRQIPPNISDDAYMEMAIYLSGKIVSRAEMK